MQARFLNSRPVFGHDQKFSSVVAVSHLALVGKDDPDVPWEMFQRNMRLVDAGISEALTDLAI